MYRSEQQQALRLDAFRAASIWSYFARSFSVVCETILNPHPRERWERWSTCRMRSLDWQTLLEVWSRNEVGILVDQKIRREWYLNFVAYFCARVI